MSGKTMDERVGDLEKLAHTLAPLPGQMAQSRHTRVADVESRLGTVESRLGTVESQIVRNSAPRWPMDLSAMKEELREDIAALGRETAAGFLHVGTEMRGLHSKMDRLLESRGRRKR